MGCEVPRNTAAGMCQEPVASAYDHHDGDISTSIQTTYTLFVKSLEKKNPVKSEAVKTGIDTNIRGEWVITYDVQDVAGNSAEQVQFALIMIDTKAPVFDISPATVTATKCTDADSCKNGGYVSKSSTATIDIELCEASNGGTQFYIDASGELTSTDSYDTESGTKLSQSNSIMSFKIDSVDKVSDKYSFDNNDGFDVPSNTFSKKVATQGKDYPFKSRDYNYGLYSADFADIFGTSNANNVFTESGTVTISCNGGATTGFIDEVETFTHDLVASQGVPSAAQRTCLGLGVEKADYSTATGLGKGTAHANANGAYTAGDEIHITGHTNWNTVKLTYNLKNTFDNAAAAQERTITITDTIAPTLYITQSSIRTAGYSGSHDANTCTGAECKCIHQEGGYSNDDNTGDFTTEHCVQNHHTDADGTTTATRVHNAHGNAIADAGTSAYGDELEIQHSAGYAQDYKYVQELMEEGNGYGCYDICSSTTTKVEWKKSCDANEEAGSEFNMLKPGTYYLKYECNDPAANKATACRTFVNVDKTRPVITVLQAANTNHNLWTVEASRDNNYVDAGATCSDMVDGNISQDVEVSGDVVNMAAVGTYKINYNCEDSAGQTAVQATRTVVVQDTTCPTCTVPGGTTTITVEASFPYTEEQSTCTDTLDGAMPNAHVYNTVNVEQTGTYVLTYSVTDKNGNGKDNSCKAASGQRTDTSLRPSLLRTP